MELGVYSFGDLTADSAGRRQAPAARLRDLLEEIRIADDVGLDVFGIGEHHRPDYVVSAPAVVLAAAAAQTRRIRLSSAVSVLSSDDPVRVFQAFSTLDLISDGRAEIMAGRGSFIESFPLFGFDLDDYDALFGEKLDLLLRLRAGERVTWSGRHRAALADQPIYPRPVQEPLPLWIAVGGSPQSVVRAGTLGLPMALAIIGGEPQRFAPLVQLYREAGRRAGHPPSALKVGINGHGWVAGTATEALDQFAPSYIAMMGVIGRERGWPPISRAQIERAGLPDGALTLGSAQEVIDKILLQHEWFGHDRTLLQLGVGTLPHAEVLAVIERLGRDVAPAVRKALGKALGPAADKPVSGRSSPAVQPAAGADL